MLPRFQLSQTVLSMGSCCLFRPRLWLAHGSGDAECGRGRRVGVGQEGAAAIGLLGLADGLGGALQRGQHAQEAGWARAPRRPLSTVLQYFPHPPLDKTDIITTLPDCLAPQGLTLCTFAWRILEQKRPAARYNDAESEASADVSIDNDTDDGDGAELKWVWSRFFPADKSIPWGIYCYQVPGSHPKAHETEVWKFISRSGEIAYGDDPQDWFDDWDLDAGDVEESTPYCEELRQFYCNGKVVEHHMGSLANYLGENSTAWELIREENPPAGAVLYNEPTPSAGRLTCRTPRRTPSCCRTPSRTTAPRCPTRCASWRRRCRVPRGMRSRG